MGYLIDNKISNFAYRQYNNNSLQIMRNSNKLFKGKVLSNNKLEGKPISQDMYVLIKNLKARSKNNQDLVSLSQVAEGGINKINEILLRIYELSIESGNSNKSNEDRFKMQNEASMLLDEINYIANETEYNGISLLNGNKYNPIDFYSNSTDILDDVTLDASSKSLGIDKIDFSSNNNSHLNIKSIKNAMKQVSRMKSKVGIFREGLEFEIRKNEDHITIIQNKEAIIQNDYMAREMMDLIKSNFKTKTSLAVMSISVKDNQYVLALLK